MFLKLLPVIDWNYLRIGSYAIELCDSLTLVACFMLMDYLISMEYEIVRIGKLLTLVSGRPTQWTPVDGRGTPRRRHSRRLWDSCFWWRLGDALNTCTWLWIGERNQRSWAVILHSCTTVHVHCKIVSHTIRCGFIQQSCIKISRFFRSV